VGVEKTLFRGFQQRNSLIIIECSFARRQKESEIATPRQRYESLSTRERGVIAMVVSGMLNKQIAAEIGTTEKCRKGASQPRHGKNAGRVSG